MLIVGALVASLAGIVVEAAPAEAAGTVQFDNTFANSTVNGTGTVTVPTSVSGTNQACLTARDNNSVGPLYSCPNRIDRAGQGKLRLTSSTANQLGAIFGQTSFPTSAGLDVTFKSYQWGGDSADGMAFMLAAVDPANPAAPASVGPGGGSLGYSTTAGVDGLDNAYLGVGLDVFGNFSSTGFQGSGCTNPPNLTNPTPGAAVVRGPGNGRVGYCGLSTTFTASGKLTLRATTREPSLVPVQVLINPTAAAFTSNSGVRVEPGTYKVTVDPVGQSLKTLEGSLPSVAAGLYPSESWLNSTGIPKQLAFAFVGSTGGSYDTHEVDDVRVLTFNPVPRLSVATTSYSAPTSTPGDPVTYDTVTKILVGADETSPVSMTQTVPVGVVPVAAFGTGWTCAAAVGRSITCTTTGSSFNDGTTLPTITVVGIVTGASVTANFIQNNTTTLASSADAYPGSTTVAAAGTPATKPTGLALNPAIGPVAGGNSVTVSGQASDYPRAVEIGTVAEQQAGTPVVLLRCAGDALLPGCFSIQGSEVVISSMPARASPATVRVTVVTQGVDAFTTYVYADKPAVPAAPTATAGISSANLTWVAPASNGSPITGYVVTPYLAGLAQSTQAFGPGVTSNTFTGLTAGTSWAYTVAAVNALGTSAPSALSATVVPYVLPGAPLITALSAADSAVKLTWTAPNNGGNTITEYVVTPYIGAVAQTTQTFGPATTQTVTGLNPGTAYTFTVAARNAAGLGPASATSAAVTPNFSPSLTFPPPPAGEVGAPYSTQLTVSNGTSPFVWSVSVGTLPAGLTLNPSTGLLSGTPTTAGTTTFTVKIVDASNQTATKSVTLVIAAAPTLTFSPPPGEVGVAYSAQPVLTGGTAPFTWSISSGSLPAGVSINPTTGLVSGTPTASGTFSVTIRVVDAFNQVASRTVNLVVVARPAFAPGAPASGQVGVAYSTTFNVTGGSLPLVWSIAAGSAPPGLTLDSATGILSGTPTAVGSSTFTMSVLDAKGQSATKAVTLVVGAGPLVIVKTADASSTTQGGQVHYTIKVTNTGPTVWHGASLSDPLSGVLDDADYNADATTTSGTVGYAGSTLSWNGDVGAGATVTITYSVTVDTPDTGNKVLSNTVTSTTLGTNCAVGSPDARCTATTSVAGLAIVKTADVATTTPGSTVHVTIVVTNTGPVTTVGSTLTDNLAGVLDDAAYNADALTTSGNVTFSSPSLTWTGNLAAGASATITYSVTVDDPDTGNRSLTGTVVSSSPGSSCPSGNPAASCSVTVPVRVPALVITNTADVATTTPGGSVHYTVTLANTGETDYTGISVSVDVAGALDDAVYDNNVAASAGSIGYLDGALVWTGSIAVGAVVTITGSVTVADPDPGNRTLTTVASSTAPGSTCRPPSLGAACTSTVQVLVPALRITKSADVSTTTPGSEVTYTVVVTNTGQTAQPGATFSDSLSGVLDDATWNGDATASAGAVAYTSPNLTWTGSLAIGATATITYSVTTRVPTAGNKTLVNTVTSTTKGNNCAASSTDVRCTSQVTVLVPGLTIVGSVDRTTATPGDVVTYTLNISNTGQTSYQDAVVDIDLSGVIDDATYNYDALVSTGTQSLNLDGVNTWTLSLAPGANAVSTASFTVNPPDDGDRVLLGLVSSDAPGSTCPVDSPNPVCRTSVQVLVPGLTITKTANRSTLTPGEVVGYTITVVNNGQTSYPAATFSDDVSDVLTDATYAGGATATTGAVAYTSPNLTWTGSLAIGATATITYSVTVRDPDPGDKLIINSVVSTSRGSNCAVDSADARCLALVRVLVPGLTLTTTANVATTRPGAAVGYSITVTNTGQTDQPGATFTDSLAGVQDDATYNGDVAATAGTAGVSGSTLTWNGSLPVGASATVTYSVTVNAADVGNDLLTNAVTSGSRGSNCLAGSTDARCTTTVPVARLILAYGPTAPTIKPGETVHFTATYTNTGQVPYTDISVDVYAPSAVDDALPGTQTASSGTLVLGASGITWIGSIPVGGVVDLSAEMQIKDPNPGDGTLTATMESSAPGNNCPVGSADPRCSITITVLTPGLTVTKAASTTATVPGGTVDYTITVHNTGQTPYVGAKATDTLAGLLDDATYNGNAAATVGAVTYSSPTLTWTGDLAVGATATITYSVTVRNPDPGDKTMVNPVSSTDVGSTCLPASGNPLCHTTVVVLTPGLTIVKTADRATTTLDTDVVYTVTVTNSGQTSYATAAFSDSLAAVLDDASYVPAATTSTSGSITYSAGVLGWSGALTPGTSATITYTVRVNAPATGDRAMTNTAVSTNTGVNCLVGGTDPRCTAGVAVTNSVSLTFAKTADVVATTAGAVVGYTVTVTNSSDTAMAADFTDPLAGILDDATLTGPAVASSGTVSSAGSQVAWSGTVPAGGTVSVTYAVTVHATVTGDQILQGTLTSTVPASSNNCLVGSLDPRCGNTVPVAGLLIQQSYTEASTTPGSLIHLTASFTNTGEMPYTGITISSPSAGVVDDATPTGDQTASSGELVLSASAITWTGNIPVGGTVTVQGTLTVNNPDTGNRILTGTLVSQALGNNCPTAGSDTRCTATLNVLLPGLTISKVADTTYVVPGGTVRYTVTVHNTGQTAYAGAVVTDSLAGVVDHATYNGNATTNIGTVTFAGSTLTWTGDLPVGATATFTYTATARSPATGDKTMVNVASSSEVGSTCPVASGNPACRSTVAVLTPALTITSHTSTPQSQPGSTVNYTVTATNTGQTPYVAASLTVNLAGVLDDASLSTGPTATRGTAGVADETLSWTGALNPGESTTVTYAVTVKSPPTGDYKLMQTVVSSAAGSTCAVGSGDPRCATVVLIASLVFDSFTDVLTTKPTGVVRNTSTFTNAGSVAYSGAVVTDDFSGTIDDATYNGDATATAGSLSFDLVAHRIVWVGDLAPGATVTVTGTVTVNNPVTGDGTLTTVLSTDAIASNCPTGTPGPGCTTSVTVLHPGLAVTKSANRATASPGEPVVYTIKATNTGQTGYTGAVVTDDLSGILNDAAFNVGTVTKSSGTISYAAPLLSWTGDLAVGATVTITFTVTVDDPYLGDGTLVNTAASGELGSTCPIGAVSPACTSAVVVLVPALDLAIVADRSTTVPGASVGYTVTVHNTGETAYVGASVTTGLAGALDDATYPGGATTTSGAVTYTAPSLTWTGDLAVGATSTISFSLTVADPDVGNLSLVTTVSSAAAGSSCGTGAACTSTVTVLIPGLSVSTTADVATATPGDHVGFTITVSNTGQTPYAGTVVTTNLSGVVDDAVLGETIISSLGVASYADPTLTWTGTLAVGQSASITYSATVRSPDPGDKTMTTTVVSLAQGSTCPVGSPNSACTATVQVLIPGLSITKTAGSPTTTPGSVVRYTIVVTNTGQTAYAEAVVDDSLSRVLPDSVYNGDATVLAGGGGSLVYAAHVLTWRGALPVGATVRFTFSITVRDPDPGDKHLVNAVSSTSPGSTCPPGSSAANCIAEVDVLVPALTITKTADTATVVAGQPVRYTVTVTNSGQTAYAPATFTDSLDDVLDDAAYSGGATADIGSVTYDSGTLTWTGELLLGATATITYSVTTDLPATGNRTLNNKVVSTSPGVTCRTGAESACTTAVTVLSPALLITKMTDASTVVAGGDLAYTITATNTGEDDYTAATLTDSLAGVLDDATYNGDATANAGVVTYAPGTLTWTGDLAMDATVTISYTVTAHVAVTGDQTLTNRVVSVTPGSTCPAASTEPGCVTSTPFEARIIQLSGLTPSFTLRGVPHDTVDSIGAVTMTVTTNSPHGYTVGVLAAAGALTSADVGNGDSISLEELTVRKSGTTVFSALSVNLATVVHQQNTASAAGGDAVSNDYRLVIPNVLPDTYSTTLNYIVTAQ